MEKLLTKTRILIWIVVALLIFNIATIATIFFHKHNRHFNFHNMPRQPEMPMPLGENAIKEQLHLTEQQFEKFKEFNSQFRDSGRNIMEHMHELRKSMIESITSANPDTAKFYKLNNELGQFHMLMKKNLVDFYFKLRSICDKEQQKILSMTMRKMLESEGAMPGFMHGRQMHNREMGKDLDSCKPPKPE